MENASGDYSELAEMWGDYIDWKKRRKAENGFLLNELHRYGCKKVFDTGLGDGCDSIYLLKNGFDVTSNEIDDAFLEKAMQNAAREGVTLNVARFDWRELHKKVSAASFDAALCNGNSLTVLPTKKERLSVLRSFRSILRPGGVLLLDMRNYDFLLVNKERLLAENYVFPKKVVYCGEKVDAKPIEITENLVLIKYSHKNGKVGFLKVFPFSRVELKELLEKAGFKKIVVWSDYREVIDENAVFYQFLAINQLPT